MKRPRGGKLFMYLVLKGVTPQPHGTIVQGGMEQYAKRVINAQLSPRAERYERSNMLCEWCVLETHSGLSIILTVRICHKLTIAGQTMRGVWGKGIL